MTDELTPLTSWAQASRETIYLWPSNREMRAMLDTLYARTVRKPTMTLAEYDARRAAFKALKGKK